MKRMGTMVAGILLWASASWATDYTWNTGNANWGAAASWSPSTAYPGQNANDTASFVGAVGRTVAFNVDPANVVDAFTVNGNPTSGAWRWTGNTYTLLIGAGNLNFNATNTLATVASFEAILAGSGKVIVNAGALRMGYQSGTHNNPFIGGVEVNGGTLLSGHNSWVAGSGNELGTGPFTIGSAAPGNTDATLLLIGGALYTNSIVIRGGNDGVARLGKWNLYEYAMTRLTGSITLQKGLTVVNGDDRIAQIGGSPWDAPIRERYPLRLDGTITGMHPVSREGLGAVYFQGVHAYTGTTTIRGGTTYIRGVNNSNVGNFTVEYGALLVQTNTSLGSAGNSLTLGVPGTFGAFGVGSTVNYIIVRMPRAVTLAGNGGIITARGSGASPRLQVDGVISGPGRLILSPGSPSNYRTSLHGENTYTGGTIATDGYMDIDSTAAHNRTVYGSGDIRVLRNGHLPVYGANNIGAGAKVRVEWPAAIHIMADFVDMVPDITSDSDGVLAIGGYPGAAINNRLADGNNPIGNGKMWLGMSWKASNIFRGSSLAALVANDPTHTYRLGYGHPDSHLKIHLDVDPGTVGALKDLNGQPHNVLIVGNRIEASDDNPFTGTLTVNPGGYYHGNVPDAVASPFGSPTGAVLLRGRPQSFWNEKFMVVNTGHTTRSVTKGALSFEGATGPLRIDAHNAGATWTTTFDVASLTRVGLGTLSIDAVQKTLGDVERMTVTGGVLSSNGMVAPYLWNGVDAVFLDYGGNGFTNAPYSLNTLTGCTASDIVYLTSGSGAVPVGGASVYAIKSSLALTGGTLTNHSGGLILSGLNIAHTAPLDFGSKEAVVYVTQANTLGGRLTGSGGLTKSGVGQLTLSAANTGSLTGGFTVNEGTLYYTSWTQLGGPANVITLNGGTLNGFDRTKAITNAIVLGPLGGSLYAGLFYGAISGPGALTSAYHDHRIMSPNNTYSGGTVINASMKVEAVSSLSTGGTVTVNSAALTLFGAGNVGNGHRLVLASGASGVYFFNTTPVIGSIEGNGTIGFGTDTITATLRVGGNNLSTDYFGILTEGENFSTTPRTLRYGKLIKEGTGTLTLWGECRYRGGTIVSNGTLCVNNWLNPDSGTVVVKSGATLDGIGTVGIVDNQGGTVKGNLHMRQLAMDAASTLDMTLNGPNAGTDYDQLNVSGSVTLGGALNLALNFEPVIGQSFTILNAGSVTGQFTSGGTIGASYGGRSYTLSVETVNGNSVVLTVKAQGTLMLIR